jgi:predicted nucleotidyltransferase
MPDIRVRQQIALMAARLMSSREEREYYTAKRKAARQLGVDHRFRPRDLPSNSEIREQILRLAECYEGDTRQRDLRDMRLAALRMMRRLTAFRPRLIGSVLTGHIRRGSDIDLHVFSDDSYSVTAVLHDERLPFTVERKRVIKHGEERIFTHVRVSERFEFELTVYAVEKVNYPFKSSITSKTIERASVAELEALLKADDPQIELDDDAMEAAESLDRFSLYKLLLEPLADVRQNAAHHPEGDALYHSLQVFELARDRYPWDEEFLLAALLHDVGKAIDPADHVAAALAALEGQIPDRTAFLIAHHMDALALEAGILGQCRSEADDGLPLWKEHGPAGAAAVRA